MPEFRHPSTIKDQIAKLVKRRHDLQAEIGLLEMENPRSTRLLMELSVLAGLLMGLEWSSCERVDLEADYRQFIEDLP